MHVIKCLQQHHPSDLIKYCHDYWGFQGVLFFVQKKRATQEIVTGSFSFDITTAEWINSISEIMTKLFRLLKLSISLFKSLIPIGLYTSKIEFASVLKQVKRNFLNLETDGRFLILATNLFYSLILKGKKLFLKHFVLV